MKITSLVVLITVPLGILVFWVFQTKHIYLCKHNFFVKCAKKVIELHHSDMLSERKHFGGGEEIFESASDKITDVPDESRSEEIIAIEREQKDFVNRKARYLEKRMQRYLKKGNMREWYILSLGCGGYTHQEVNKFFYSTGCKMLGIDVQDFNTIAFKKLFHSESILANAMRIPIADNRFDCVLFTDVLEHLHDPVAGLKEIHRVLKPGGILIMTTNNRRHFKLIINPLILLIFFAGKWFPSLLPKRDLYQEIEGKIFYHTEFAEKELKYILKLTGFKKWGISTKNFFSSEEVYQKVFPRIMEKFGMGEEFFVVAEKSTGNVNRQC